MEVIKVFFMSFWVLFELFGKAIKSRINPKLLKALALLSSTVATIHMTMFVTQYAIFAVPLILIGMVVL